MHVCVELSWARVRKLGDAKKAKSDFSAAAPSSSFEPNSAGREQIFYSIFGKTQKVSIDPMLTNCPSIFLSPRLSISSFI